MSSDLPRKSESDKPIEVAPPMSYVRIYSDSEGETHFSDEPLTFTLEDYAPPAPPISVSKKLASESMVFISSPHGWFGDWHPVPRRQLMLMLSGELEVEVSDGEKRRFLPGSVAMVEDTTGRGHASRVVSGERAYMMAIPLKDDEES